MLKLHEFIWQKKLHVFLGNALRYLRKSLVKQYVILYKISHSQICRRNAWKNDLESVFNLFTCTIGPSAVEYGLNGYEDRVFDLTKNKKNVMTNL